MTHNRMITVVAPSLDEPVVLLFATLIYLLRLNRDFFYNNTHKFKLLPTRWTLDDINYSRALLDPKDYYDYNWRGKLQCWSPILGMQDLLEKQAGTDHSRLLWRITYF